MLCLDAGSSSLKYTAYAIPPDRGVRAEDALIRETVETGDPEAALARVAAALSAHDIRPRAVGHRVTCGGMRHAVPERIGAELLRDLAALVPLDRTHLPGILAAIRSAGARYPEAPAFACFDGAFHATMPEVARRLPLPPEAAPELRRFGYHGLSYEYVAGALAERGIGGRTIVAHLGSGASLAAMRDGIPLDTTMSVTPTSGIVMSTRSGDLDPGLVLRLVERELDGGADGPRALDAVRTLLEHGSGLVGIGGVADMRDLLVRRGHDERARAAVETFVYQAASRAAALTVPLGGLETLVFTGGIGEHAAPVRAEICARLAHLGVRTDAEANARDAERISPAGAPVGVLVIPTDENLVIARHVQANFARA